MYSFKLLNALYACNPISTLGQYLPTILNLLLQRMQEAVKEGKTARYCRLFIHSLCVFSAVYGPQLLVETLETITPGLVGMLVLNIWSVNRDKLAAADEVEVKQTIVGATRLLTESPFLLQKPDVWGSLLKSTVALLGATSHSRTNTAEDLLLGEEGTGESTEFDSAYSKLAYATIPVVDCCAEVDTAAAPAYFAKSFVAFSRSAGAQIMSGIPQFLDASEVAALQQLMQKV